MRLREQDAAEGQAGRRAVLADFSINGPLFTLQALTSDLRNAAIKPSVLGENRK
jgi:hypothetical protein